MDTFLLAMKVVGQLAVPPASIAILLLAGLVVRKKYRRTSTALLWFGTLILIALSTPITAYPLGRLASTAYALDVSALEGAQAIVILGGGVRPHADEYAGETLKWTTLERVRYGAKLARDTGLPVLVAGGRTFSVHSEAQLMRDALQQEFHVAVRWLEAESRNTHENAVRTSALLRAEGIRRVLLVTHGMHMRRAQAEFEAAGLEVIAAPTVPTRRFEYEGVFDLLPNASTLFGSTYALHEALGYLAFRLRPH